MSELVDHPEFGQELKASALRVGQVYIIGRSGKYCTSNCVYVDADVVAFKMGHIGLVLRRFPDDTLSDDTVNGVKVWDWLDPEKKPQ